VRTVAEGLTLQKSVPLPPGQYQVRLAAREASRSLLGSVSRWVEIPDLDARPPRSAASSCWQTCRSKSARRTRRGRTRRRRPGT
jgi:hypothetical protein